MLYARVFSDEVIGNCIAIKYIRALNFDAALDIILVILA